ncbi:transcription factor TFIIIB component B'' homolog isoform X3 [Cyclopterus lumpus]|uniref:transcription factor TFIIIB component B'' homolog isoform X3 n=1 Tax=Cyclopterus lumpus TaxID=8103 RepID=UPI0014862EB8|nr:transcription factor TFIIIB component B'' homolog isoform X3 [Cyclopterus lumpus]
MFRRARFSVRPNVGATGKTPQEAPSATPEAGETPKDVGEGGAAVTDHQSVGTSSERPTASGDGIEQHGEGTGSSAAVQRRKRFSVKPKVAPGRPSTVARMQKSHVQAASETPDEVPVSDQTRTAVAPQRLQSPRRRRPSEDGKQPKASPVPPGGSEPSADDPAANLPAASGEASESASGGQEKGAPSRPPDDVPLSLPDKEAMEISEKARTLVSSKSGRARSPPAFSLSRLLNDPSDLQRLAKAQKLRELLRREMHKEKKLKKGNLRVQEFNLDPAKMTMSDLIRYLPQSNPMTSSLEEAAQENETVVPPTPRREASPERAPEPVVLPKMGSPGAGEGGDEEEEEEEEEEDSSMVPQVKVAEDGTLIIDEESLTVEVLRAKGPNPAQDRDPIFERGSTTTYASFRKGTYTKPWSNEETDMFFLAISMVGTDFSMICQLFALRTRSEIKNKFKKEERENSWRVDKAFRERRKLDIEYFSKLLEKIMEVHKNRKKLRSLAAKNSPKKTERKPKAATKARKPSVVEEGDEKEEKQIADLEEEGEKENEDLRNEGGADAAKKKKRKRKNRDDAPTGEPDDKKNKKKQDEADVPADTEADCPPSDMTESANEAADAKIKPAKLSRGKAPKPLVPLGRKRAKKPPPASTETTATDKEDQGVMDGDDEDQVKSQADGRKSPTEDSEEEDAALQPQRPTRSGRVPKPIQLLNYPAREAAPEASPASPEGSARPKAKSTAKRRRPSKLPSSQESKKPKLVTLRASQSEYSDEEDEKQRGGGGGGGGGEYEDEDVEEDEHPVWGSRNDSTAPVFVPASLRSPRPVIPEVEETVEELDILANIPDVLGISHDALFPDASCERAHSETGAAEPCEHQLDLLVDVIDFLSSDHIEVSENENESYNEAAQTLLTIGNLAPLPPSEQDQEATQDDATANVNETSRRLEEEISSTPAELEESGAVPSDRGATETSGAVVELLDGDGVSLVEAIDQRTGFQMDPAPQSPGSSKTNSPQAKKGRSSKAKPKPNLGPASRTARSQPGPSAVRGSEESHAVAPRLAPTTETPSAAEDTPKMAECSKNTLGDDISSIGVEPTEEPSGGEKTSVGEGQPLEKQPQGSSEAQLEPRVEPASGDSGSTSGSTEEVPTAERSCSNQVTSDTAVTETQLAQESIDHPAPRAPPAEEVPVTQKEESDVGPTQPTRKSRFQKVKPKLNLAQTSRSLGSKDSPPTPHPKVHEHTTEVEAEPAVTTSSCCPDAASDLIPLVTVGTTLRPTEEVSTPEEEKSDVGVVGRVEPDAETPHRSVPEAQFPPRREQATRDPTPTSESSAESRCDDPQPTSDPGVTESLRGGSDLDPAPVTRAEELPAGQKEESDAASPRRRLQKVKPKPNLPPTSRTARSKPPTTKDSVAPPQPTETPSSQTSRAEDTEDTRAEARLTCSAAPPSPIKSTSASSVSLCSTQRTTDERSSDVGLDSKGSEQKVPPRRQRFSRVKPNLGSPKSPRTTHAKLQADDLSKPPEPPGHVDTSFTSEPQPVDDNDAQTKRELTGTDSPRAEPPESGLAIAEYWSLNTDPKGLAVEGGDRTASTDQVEHAPASQRDQDRSTRSTGSNTRPTGGPSAASDVRSSGGGSTPPTRTQSAAGSKDEVECEAQSPDSVQQGSEPNHTAAQSDPSEPTDSPSRRAPQARRGRLVKPKPRLVPSSRPPPPRQVQNTKRAETGFGAEGVSDLRPDIPDPTEGATVQHRDPNSSPHDADGCPQAAGGTQSLPIFPDTSAPSSQEPSDPEEPFFILSLTEIPVCSLSEPVAGGPERLPRAPGANGHQSVPGEAPERLPRAPGTDAPLEHQSSVPGEAPPSSAAAPVEESGEADLVWVWDIEPAASTTQPGRAMENPVEPHETSTVHPPETETPKEPGGPTRRRVKEPVKPEATKRKQAGKTLVAKGAASTPIQTDAAGPSELPEASVDVVGESRGGSGDRVDVEKETPTGGGGVPEESGAGARATRTRVTRSQNRKPKGFTETDAPPPGKAAPKGPRVRTPRAAGKRLTPAPAASAKRAPPTHTPNASPCPAEAPASQRSDSRKKEEPTSREEEEEPTSRKEEAPTSRKKEEPTSRKEEAPTSRKKEEPTSRKKEEPTSRKKEEPTSREEEEEPTSREEKEPTSRKEEAPTSRKKEEPTSRKKEEPTSRKKEEPTSRKEEEPTSRKDEESTSRKEEAPTSRKKEEPTSRKDEESTSRKDEESTSRKDEESTSREEEESTSREEEESTSRKEEESTSRKKEEPTSRKEEEPTSRKEEEPTSREEEEEPTSVSQYFLCDIFTDVEEG